MKNYDTEATSRVRIGEECQLRKRKRVISQMQTSKRIEKDFLQSLDWGRAVRLVREEHKVTQVQLGEILGLQQAAVSRIEKGLQNLSAEHLYLLSDHFEISIDRLIFALKGGGQFDISSMKVAAKP